MSAELVPADGLERLEFHEKGISGDLASAGGHFKAIRENELWRFKDYTDWGDYCERCWNTSQSSMNRFIQQEDRLAAIAGVVPKGFVLTQKAAIAMSDLSDEQTREVAETLVEEGVRKPTVEKVKETRKKLGFDEKKERNAARIRHKGLFKEVEGLLEKQEKEEAETPFVESDWMNWFSTSCNRVTELFGVLGARELQERHRASVVVALRRLAESIPDSLAWLPEVDPVPLTVDMAIAQAQGLAQTAQNWKDEESVGLLLEALRKALRRLEGKVRKTEDSKFVVPTVEEVREHVNEMGWQAYVDPESFVAFYESKGWKVGNQKMKSWKSAVVTWKKKSESNGHFGSRPTRELAGKEYGQAGRI